MPWGGNLQRLFTMFPGGWPGAGLLVLRLAAAIPLLLEGCSGFLGATHDGLYARFIAIGVGSLLLAGLWTPVEGALQAVIEVWIIFGRRSRDALRNGGRSRFLPSAGETAPATQLFKLS